jgi:UMF1 family MFS transporter
MGSGGEPARPPPAPRLLSRLSQASKRSFYSHSSSFEADDERSSTASLEDLGMMSRSRSRSPSSGGGDDHDDDDNDTSSRRLSGSSLGAPPPRYLGDDTRPTSPKELAGWYAYSFAAEVYVICGQLPRQWIGSLVCVRSC